MRITWGSTRLVLLVGNNAVKIARIRPIRFLLRMPLIAFSKKRRRHFFEKYGATFIRAMQNDVFAGVVANKNEYAYYQKYRDDRVMPTLQQFLCGYIIVQTRGVPISVDELLEENPLKGLVSIPVYEVDKPNQFCRHPDGRLVLIDYGKIETQLLLRTTKN